MRISPFYLFIFACLLAKPSFAQQGINSAAGTDLPIGAGGQTAITVSGGGTAGVPVGNVGIGTTTPRAKLDVTGEIKSGNTNLACSAAINGSIRYNSGTKIMEYCNGTSWMQMGGGGSSGSLCGWGRLFTGAERGPSCQGTSVVACMGYAIVNSRCSANCPAGYTFVSLFSDAANAGDGSYTQVTCVKN